MKRFMKKTDANVRKTRALARKLNFKKTISKPSGRAFDAVAYAAALEVLG